MQDLKLPTINEIDEKAESYQKDELFALIVAWIEGVPFHCPFCREQAGLQLGATSLANLEEIIYGNRLYRFTDNSDKKSNH